MTKPRYKLVRVLKAVCKGCVLYARIADTGLGCGSPGCVQADLSKPGHKKIYIVKEVKNAN